MYKCSDHDFCRIIETKSDLKTKCMSHFSPVKSEKIGYIEEDTHTFIIYFQFDVHFSGSFSLTTSQSYMCSKN